MTQLDPLPVPDPDALKRLHGVRWLFFDVGYTLLDETGGWQEQFERLSRATRNNLQARPVDVAELWSIYHACCTGFAPGQWRAICERCACSANEVPELVALSKGWKHDLETPYPGVLDAVAALASRYQLGVIANQAIGTRDRLERHGLLPFIRVLISSAEAGVNKPDPAIFQLALREANCQPSEAAMVGDRLDNDVAPANRLGMLSVHVRQGGSGAQRPRTADEVATLTVDDVPTLARLLK